MSTPVHWIFFSLVFLLLPPAIPLFLDLRYRRSLTVPTGFSLDHEEEAIVINTNELHAAGKIQSDCSDFVFIQESSGANITLPWWTETRCPALTTASPYTTIWVEFPETFDLSDLFWMAYGQLRPDHVEIGAAAPVNEGRLVWENSGVEIRLSIALPIPDGYEILSQWDNYALQMCSFPPQSCGATVPPIGSHSHTIPNSGTCTFPFDTTLMTPVCQNTSTGTTFALSSDLDHSDCHSYSDVGEVQTDQEIGGLPDRFAYVPLISSTAAGYRLDFESGNSFVAIFVEPPSSDWLHHSDSTERFVAFGTSPGVLPQQNLGHSISSYPPIMGEWHSANCTPFGDIEDGANPVDCTPSHQHDILSLSVVGPQIEGTPPHTRAHVYFPMDDVLLSGNSWVPQTQGMVYLFLRSLPPLGFVQLFHRSGMLVRGFPGNNDTAAFQEISSEMHRHSVHATLGRSPVPGTSCLVRSSLSCPADVGRGMFDDHVHSCTQVSYPEMQGLPPTVRVAMALRYDFDREVSAGEEVEMFYIAGENRGDPPPQDRFRLTSVVVGVVVGFVAILIIVVVVVVVVVVFCCRRRKGSKDADVAPDPSETELESQSLVMKAKLDLDSSLFEIKYETIEVKEKLGKGGGGFVFRALWSGKEVAYKVFQLSMLGEDDGTDFSLFEREVKILGSLAHPNVLRFFGASLHPPRCGFVMEFCKHGDLLHYVVADSPKTALRLRLLVETAQGLAFLHEKMIIHRDVKPENVLVSDNLEAKVCDFGLSKILERNQELQTRNIGTSAYMAPELFRGNYDHKVDCFAFGVMCFVVLTGDPRPYGDAIHPEIAVASDPEFRPGIKGAVFEEIPWIVELLKRTWHHEPVARPEMIEIAATLSTKVAQS